MLFIKLLLIIEMMSQIYNEDSKTFEKSSTS